MSVDALGRTRKTHCIRGHQFDGTEKWKTNWKGYKCRECRECSKNRMRERRERPGYRAQETEKMRIWRAAHPELNRATTKRAYQKRNQWIQAFKVKCKFCT